MNILRKIIGGLFASKFKLKGELKIERIEHDGSRTLLMHHHNLVVTVGKGLAVTRLISNTTMAVIGYIAVGTVTNAPAITDQALGGELTRRAFDSAATVSGNVATMVATFGPGVGTGNWAEAGLFNAASGATMFSRTTFTAIPKGANDTIAITWNVTAN